MDLAKARNTHLSNTRKTNKMKRKQVKVVYISTPLKVNTCPSNFRALVQELTGKDSNICDLAETNNGIFMDSSDVSPPQSSRESPTTTSSDSVIEPRFGDIMDDIFVDGSFGLEESAFFGINLSQFVSCDQLLSSYGVMSNY